MVIIFEGHDGSGKTNIAKALSKTLGIPYFKNRKEREWFERGELAFATKYGGLYLANFIASVKCSVIIDRGHISEYVYAKVFNRQTDVKAILEIDKIYGSIGAKVVYCYKDDLSKYADIFVAVEHVAAIKRLYDEFFRLTSCDVFKLKTDDENIQRQIGMIIGWL